ncbi:triose-phosphate isomerase [Candidatus Nitrosocosmicus arcticus]|uniref:Triose-phosphate isomerase n=1 Tax=Candidatus Nitrosocosmicus arcticus TaxID=2035267 RepID=A0A557SVK0_9ARCH|nr:triose-phosphate isomerase [Candidatus Nitrosocosmicus arcticus]TVP40639.1 triosephosphate isomerase [Candidatus Nitrosocosmicus arcticus]
MKNSNKPAQTKMSNRKGPLIINFKNYLEISGDKALSLTKEAERVSEQTDIEIVLSPPQVLLAWLAKNTKLSVIAQHLDVQQPGPSTGFSIPEIVKDVGGAGSLINHSEHPINLNIIRDLIPRLRSLGLLSIVCAKNLAELRDISSIGPDFVAIEPPELIGTKKSISTEKPSLITDSFQHLKLEASRSQLICGAGINSSEDVRIAVQLGSKGILAASSVVKSKNWYEKIYELASQF